MALHLKFALNLDSLVEEMIGEVLKAWRSPFDAPKILFSEYKLEQWFRLRWMEKKGVLANLNKASLDNFLFEILGGGEKDKSGKIQKKLSVNLLRNAVIAYLQELGKAGKEAVDKKLPGRVAGYLFPEDSNGEIDESRLFDLANKMAALFLEYEISRPSHFWKDLEGEKPGILDCWKQGNLKPFFLDGNGREVENEKWERELYSAIFHNENGESLLTRAFEKVNPDSRYLTLPFMFEACREDGAPKFRYASENPVFILGLSGMGQFYRVVLQEFAKSHEVYVYLQNPCMDFWEDVEFKKAPSKWVLDEDAEEPLKADENDLLLAWGRAGRDSIKLWCMGSDYGFSFPEKEELFHGETFPVDSRLHQVQWMVAKRKNEIPEEARVKDEDESLTLTAAPNRIREVEAIHSRICKLLNGGANVRDILVVSPNLPEYRSAIFQVFDQKERGDADGVRLPFVIVDSAAKKSLVGEALENLFDIKRSGAVNRVNFFSLMRNPVVQAARGVSSEKVSNWEAWVSGMGVYRDHKSPNNQKEDWLCGVKRLLLARVSDSPVGEYAPYADMNSANDSDLNRFAEAVDSLEDWIRMDSLVGEESSFSKIRNFLSGWLSMPNAPKELLGESIVFKSVLSSLDDLKYQFAAGAEKISWDMVSMSLRDSVETSAYSFGSLFVNGITFMKFVPNRTVPVKHLFFMGANAKDFPGTKSFDSLDLRKSVPQWPGDDTAVQRNRYAFLCQLMSTSESFHISYQNVYLPKDEKLYPSSVVVDLQGFLEKRFGKSLAVREMAIDEKREWVELFTARERRNKKTLALFGQEKTAKVPEKAVATPKSADAKKLPSRVNVYSIKKFLENPFTFQVDRALHVENVEEDPEKELFEPIELDALKSCLLQNEMVAQNLEAAEKDDSLTFDALSRKGQIPSGPFGKKAFDDLESKAKEFAEKIRSHFHDAVFCTRNLEVEIPQTGASLNWTLSGTVRLCAKSDDKILLVDVKKSAEPKAFISNYVAALGLLASGESNACTVAVFGADKDEPMTVDISLSKEKARERLNAIYGEMFVKNFRKLVPFSLLYGKTVSSYAELIKESKDKDIKYFAAKDLLDCRRESVGGYSTKGAKKGEPWGEWEKAKESMKSLMPEIISFAETQKEQKSSGNKKGGK